MRLRITDIGNSRGLILPKALLKQAHLDNKVELEVTVEDNKLILSSPATHARAGWREHFDKIKVEPLTEEDKDFLNFGNKFDEEEWTW